MAPAGECREKEEEKDDQVVGWLQSVDVTSGAAFGRGAAGFLGGREGKIYLFDLGTEVWHSKQKQITDAILVTFLCAYFLGGDILWEWYIKKIWLLSIRAMECYTTHLLSIIK